MQQLKFKNALDSVTTEIVFKSKYYTVARAKVIVPNGEGEQREVCAEGIARRSFKDVNNEQLGIEIAEGRARKALSEKLAGFHPRHVLMNG